MSKLLFLRHGKTTYSGKFPDLTLEGTDQIRAAAEVIDERVKGAKEVRIVSSPLPRALGSADIIARWLGIPPESITQEAALRCMDFYDPKGAEALWASFPSARHVDCAYEHGPLFELGVVVEKRSAILRRFYGYLGTLFEQFIAGTLPEVIIHTSHFEVLWHMAQKFGFEEPLLHGEVIQMDLTKLRVAEYIKVRGTFRGRAQEPVYRAPIDLFTNQFVP